MKHTAHRVRFEHSNVFVRYLRYLDKRMPSYSRNNIIKNALILSQDPASSDKEQSILCFKRKKSEPVEAKL